MSNIYKIGFVSRLSALFIALFFCVAAFAVEPQGLPRPLLNAPLVNGGYKVSSEQSPWQVALIATGRPSFINAVFCGGTLIDSRWVLTAAHCLYDPENGLPISNQSFFVGYGSVDLEKGVSLVAPEEIFTHEGYRFGHLDNDVALLRLSRNAAVSSVMKLPSKEIAAALVGKGKILKATGWGITSSGGSKSRKLLEVEVPVVSIEECKGHYDKEPPAGTVCAGKKGKDTCTWDSGGPLYSRGEGATAVQVGIVSYGKGCGDGVPGVYSPVVNYLDWIEKKKFEAGGCTPLRRQQNIC